jgi:hypothetical protein
MADDIKRIEQDETAEHRSLSTTLAAAALTGTTAGLANATAQHMFGKLTGSDKSQEAKDAPSSDKPKED